LLITEPENESIENSNPELLRSTSTAEELWEQNDWQVAMELTCYDRRRKGKDSANAKRDYNLLLISRWSRMVTDQSPTPTPDTSGSG
jgi:hypothetical protein